MKKLIIFVALFSVLWLMTDAQAVTCPTTDLSVQAGNFNQAVDDFVLTFNLGRSFRGHMTPMEALDQNVQALRGDAQCLAMSNRDMDVSQGRGCRALNAQFSTIRSEMRYLETAFNFDSTSYRGDTIYKWRKVLEAYQQLHNAIRG